MKCWFNIKIGYNKIGIITDLFGDYIEIQCDETGEYYIKHISKIEIVKTS